MPERITPPWALILAGGDGTRLRPLTSQITGDDRPEQFCALLDGETLLDRTCRRADQRVLASLVRTGVRPAWIDRVRLAEAS